MEQTEPIHDTQEVRNQIARIAVSNSFKRRRRLLELFEYLVSETMAGRHELLTQKRIAADVYRLGNSFDPQSDGTVRIAAARLRNAIEEYYKRESAPDEPRIQIPARRYYIALEKPKVQANEDIELAPPRKKIGPNDILGELGVNLIQRICLEMGFVWYSTGLEAGIDGYIEIRSESGIVTNCIIQVQSKATEGTFDAETPSGFEFRCSPKDLDYWIGGNAPVILVRCRPSTNEAYWVSIKDYFSDLNRRKSAKVVFDKVLNRFDITAKEALKCLAVPAASGLYLGPRPKPELVYSNLLQLAHFPAKYYVAETEYRTRAELFATLHEISDTVHGEWILGNKMLTSFHDLSAKPWSDVCERGTMEALDTYEWAQTDDHLRQRQFVQLLNACLRSSLYRKGVKFSRDGQCYYFRASRDLSERQFAYQSREYNTSRLVFRGYPKKSDQSQMSYYRHSAFAGRFVRYGPNWFLQITPTYHFTRDGERVSRYAPELLSGIKRLETNQAVHGQVVMWAQLLKDRSLFDVGPSFLDFSSLLKFHVEAGFDDESWLKHEEAENYAGLQTELISNRQESLIL
jgi:hypothetical protein